MSVKQVNMTRDQVIELHDKLTKIALFDEKEEFSPDECAKAAKALKELGIIAPTSTVRKNSLKLFTEKLGTIIETEFYRVELTVENTKKEFKITDFETDIFNNPYVSDHSDWGDVRNDLPSHLISSGVKIVI